MALIVPNGSGDSAGMAFIKTLSACRATGRRAAIADVPGAHQQSDLPSTWTQSGGLCGPYHIRLASLAVFRQPCSQELWQKGWEEAFDREVQAVALFLCAK